MQGGGTGSGRVLSTPRAVNEVVLVQGKVHPSHPDVRARPAGAGSSSQLRCRAAGEAWIRRSRAEPMTPPRQSERGGAGSPQYHREGRRKRCPDAVLQRSCDTRGQSREQQPGNGETCTGVTVRISKTSVYGKSQLGTSVCIGGHQRWWE